MSASTERNETAEEAARRRRMAMIFDAREQVYETHARIEERQARRGGAPGRAAKRLLHVAATNYVRQVMPLMRPDTRPNYDVERDYWGSVEVGTMLLPDGSEQTIVGLGNFFALPNPWIYRWKEATSDDFGESTQVRRQAIQPPTDLSLAAASLTDLFLADAGFDIEQPDLETRVAGNSYADITEQNPPADHSAFTESTAEGD